MDKLKDIARHLSPSPRMPVIFVGHGNPMNALYDNDITKNWAQVGRNLPDAQAIVVISAHWLTRGTHVTDAPKQQVIYDFYGFPDELYQVEYRANGDPEIAKLLAAALQRYEAKLDSTWGLDHGTWSVLRHLAPEPKVPVLQISLDMTQPLPGLIKLFAELRPLRERGVVFIGSGNIVHNLRAINWMDDKVFEWAEEFDIATAAAISSHDVSALAQPHKLSDGYRMAVPTDDHYRPMLAAMALLDADEDISYFNDVIEMGIVGMRSFVGARRD